MEEKIYLLRRGWWTHPVFCTPLSRYRHSRREAWLFLIEQAIRRNGTIPTSIRDLAREWRWNDNRVRYFLKKLEGYGMVKVSKTRYRHLVIEIVDFAQYLPPTDAPPAQAVTAPAPTQAQAQDPIAPAPLPTAQPDLFAPHGGAS